MEYALLIHIGIYLRIKVLHNNLEINLFIMEDVIIKISILKSKVCHSSLLK